MRIWSATPHAFNKGGKIFLQIRPVFLGVPAFVGAWAYGHSHIAAVNDTAMNLFWRSEQLIVETFVHHVLKQDEEPPPAEVKSAEKGPIALIPAGAGWRQIPAKPCPPKKKRPAPKRRVVEPSPGDEPRQEEPGPYSDSYYAEDRQ